MSLEIILSILEKGLSLWDSKESRKYIDRVIYLKKQYSKEIARSDSSDLAIDEILEELNIIAAAFTNSPAGMKDSK